MIQPYPGFVEHGVKAVSDAGDEAHGRTFLDLSLGGEVEFGLMHLAELSQR